MNEELSERDRDTDKQERRERIKESRFNRKYWKCMTEEIPEYLPREKECKRNKNDGEFRCVNEERENRYWMEEEERRRKIWYEERDH
jgi:hypothetical protein